MSASIDISSVPPSELLSAARRLAQRVPFRGPAVLHGTERAPLRGQLPAWLRGELLRVAPAFGATPRWAPAHWFDALGLAYAISVDNTGLGLRWSTLDCQMGVAAMGGSVPLGQFGSKNQRAARKRLVEPIPGLTDNANVNVIQMGPDWVCMTETPHQLVLEPATLRVRGRVQYADDLAGYSPLAHPIVTGEVLTNLASHLGPRSEIVLYQHHLASRTRRRLGSFTTPDYPYIHSFGLTAQHGIVIDHPLRLRAMGLLWSNRGVIEHFRWQRSTPTRLMLIDRATGRVRAHETDAFFCFHTVHAFETSEATVLDLLAYPDASIIEELSVIGLAAHGPTTNPTLRRYSIDRRTGKVTQRVLSDAGFEFPQLDWQRAADKAASAVFGTQLHSRGIEMRSEIVRVALEQGDTLRFGEAGYVFGEPLFVGQPGREREGQGVLLSVGSSERGSALFVLDAQTLGVVAHAEFQAPLPLGFHGSFIPA